MRYKNLLGLFISILTASLSIGVFPVAAGAASNGPKQNDLDDSIGQVDNLSTTKPRLLVLTDISSIKAGYLEPDDAQSMIRLMLYANEFDIEGLIASAAFKSVTVKPQNIRAIVNAYGKVRSNLVVNNKSYPWTEQKSYPTAQYLKSLIKSGQPNANRGVPVFRSIGNGKDTEASRWIIQRVDAPDSRPLWITAWGGTADLAQALWKVRQTRSSAQLAHFLGKIRVLASGDQDSTGPWIKSQFPDLIYVTRKNGGRGMYRGGNQSLVSSAWVQRNIKGHGALGDMYPDYRGGDIWVGQLGRVKGIKGGDSATFMGLIRNGLNVGQRLTLDNWGGRLEQDSDNPHHYHEAIDPVANYKNDISPYIASVYRWRPDFQAEYAARWDWSTKSYSQVNHPPIDRSGHPVFRNHFPAGKAITLHTGRWSDPDGNNLTYNWQVLKEESTYKGKIDIKKLGYNSARFVAPKVNSQQSIHLLLKVEDNGQPALTSYKRYEFTIKPNNSTPSPTPTPDTNHAPVDQSGRAVFRNSFSAGQKITIYPGRWSDPDGDKLAYSWETLRDESTYKGGLNINRLSRKSAEFTAPNVKSSRSLHLLLTVKDNGRPAATSYKRYEFTINPR